MAADFFAAGAGFFDGFVVVVDGAGGVVVTGEGATDVTPVGAGAAGSRYNRGTLSASASTNADPPTSVYGLTGCPLEAAPLLPVGLVPVLAPPMTAPPGVAATTSWSALRHQITPAPTLSGDHPAGNELTEPVARFSTADPLTPVRPCGDTINGAAAAAEVGICALVQAGVNVDTPLARTTCICAPPGPALVGVQDCTNCPAVTATVVPPVKPFGAGNVIGFPATVGEVTFQA